MWVPSLENFVDLFLGWNSFFVLWDEAEGPTEVCICGEAPASLPFSGEVHVGLRWNVNTIWMKLTDARSTEACSKTVLLNHCCIITPDIIRVNNFSTLHHAWKLHMDIRSLQRPVLVHTAKLSWSSRWKIAKSLCFFPPVAKLRPVYTALRAIGVSVDATSTPELEVSSNFTGFTRLGVELSSVFVPFVCFSCLQSVFFNQSCIQNSCSAWCTARWSSRPLQTSFSNQISTRRSRKTVKTLCLPVSIASSERSFSTLKRLKTCLKSSMSQKRSTHLTLMQAHADIVEQLSLEDLIQSAKLHLCYHKIWVASQTKPSANLDKARRETMWESGVQRKLQ